jgi:hypothetical protein
LEDCKAKEPHTIGEELVKPAAIDTVHMACGHETAKKIEQIPLSNDTIRTCIYDMLNDIKQQVTAVIKTSRQFSLQLDKTTDVMMHSSQHMHAIHG